MHWKYQLGTQMPEEMSILMPRWEWTPSKWDAEYLIVNVKLKWMTGVNWAMNIVVQLLVLKHSIILKLSNFLHLPNANFSLQTLTAHFQLCNGMPFDRKLHMLSVSISEISNTSLNSWHAGVGGLCHFDMFVYFILWIFSNPIQNLVSPCSLG